MTNKKVYWLLDEVFLQTAPINWTKILYLTNDLINLIGRKDVVHEIINPLDSLQKLAKALNGIRPSIIIDVSGWIGYNLKPLFPKTKLISDFSISRILDVSTTDFRPAGYEINASMDEILRKAAGFDLSNVLIIDDATVSGLTNQTIMKVWRINPANTIHAALFMNLGNFITPSGKHEGAASFLEKLGSQIIYGDRMVTPQDDAEHLRDVFNHHNLEVGFQTALRLHDIIIKSKDYGKQLKYFIATDLSGRELFSQQFTKLDLMRLSSDRRFIAHPNYVSSETPLYAKNPLLWAFDEFWGKIDITAVRSNQKAILSILQQFQNLTTNKKGS